MPKVATKDFHRSFALYGVARQITKKKGDPVTVEEVGGEELVNLERDGLITEDEVRAKPSTTKKNTPEDGQ